MKRARLELGAKGAANEFLAQRLPELAVDQRHAALPTRAQLLHAAQRAAEEGEVLVDECRRQVGRGGAGVVPSQVRLRIVERHQAKLPLQLLVELRLGDVEDVEARQAGGGQVGVPVKLGSETAAALNVPFVE